MLVLSKRQGGILLVTAVLLAALLLSPSLPAARAQSAMLSAASSSSTSDTASGDDTNPSSDSHLTLAVLLHNDGVELKWTSHLPNVAFFRIERSERGANKFIEIATVPLTVTDLRDPQIKTTQADYRIIALDGNHKPLDVSAVVSPTKFNLLDVLTGEHVTLSDLKDFSFWQVTANNILQAILTFIPKFISALILFGLFYLFYRLIRRVMIGSMTRAHVDSSIRDMLSALLRWTILGFALIIACDQIGIQIAALLTGVSIIGLAIGFAAQETLANFIAGVVIFWDKPFRVGDWIIIDGMFGRVTRVSFRSTRMLNLTGETVVMPNTYMLANRVANHSTHPHVRIEIPIGIAYKESIDKARSALLSTIAGDHRICKDPPPSVVVSACGDSSVNLLLRLWTQEEAEEKTIFYEYLERAKNALDAAKIEIPFPHVQLLLENGSAIDPRPPKS